MMSKNDDAESVIKNFEAPGLVHNKLSSYTVEWKQEEIPLHGAIVKATNGQFHGFIVDFERENVSHWGMSIECSIKKWKLRRK